MSETAQIITASLGGLGILGGAIKFVWAKVERRFTAIERELANCRSRELKSADRRSAQLIVIELLWQEVKRLAPGSPVLTRGKHLLDELKEKAGAEAEGDDV